MWHGQNTTCPYRRSYGGDIFSDMCFLCSSSIVYTHDQLSKVRAIRNIFKKQNNIFKNDTKFIFLRNNSSRQIILPVCAFVDTHLQWIRDLVFYSSTLLCPKPESQNTDGCQENIHSWSMPGDNQSFVSNKQMKKKKSCGYLFSFTWLRSLGSAVVDMKFGHSGHLLAVSESWEVAGCFGSSPLVWS